MLPTLVQEYPNLDPKGGGRKIRGNHQLLCTSREQNIVLANLAHKQSLENLELNRRILDLHRQQEIMVETTIGKEVQKATDRIKTTMELITKERLPCQVRLPVWASA